MKKKGPEQSGLFCFDAAREASADLTCAIRQPPLSLLLAAAADPS
jgi:hypothetical protein